MGTLVQNVVMMMGTLMQRVILMCFQNLLLSLLTVMAVQFAQAKPNRRYATELPRTSIVLLSRD